MKILLLCLLLSPALLHAQAPAALHPDDVPSITVSPGVILKELTGRTAPETARSDKTSVALFHLEPGCASAWSLNKTGEESFFVLRGHGEICTGTQTQALRPGSYILVPPGLVRSIRAAQDEALDFYAVTSPAWTREDDVLTSAPK